MHGSGLTWRDVPVGGHGRKIVRPCSQLEALMQAHWWGLAQHLTLGLAPRVVNTPSTERVRLGGSAGGGGGAGARGPA